MQPAPEVENGVFFEDSREQKVHRLNAQHHGGPEEEVTPTIASQNRYESPYKQDSKRISQIKKQHTQKKTAAAPGGQAYVF